VTADLQPLLDRDRYTDEEWALSSAGLCDEVIEYGMHPGRIVHCGERSSPVSVYRLCASHDEDARQSPGYGR
jgi:hypothetical protein